jgi:sugar fermentation stimulation protein A
MNMDRELIEGRLLKRYKRFLADVELEDGSVITSHCPNSGSMKTCADKGWKVLLSKSENPKRKYSTTLEWIHNGKTWIGVNTHKANTLVGEFIARGEIAPLSGYLSQRAEVKISDHSRIDWVLDPDPSEDRPACFVEVKSVTLLGEDGTYQFPDAVTSRGTKHLRELQKLVTLGKRGVMLFLVRREDGTYFRPAREIDPTYAQALEEAIKSGVEVIVCGTKASPPGVTCTGEIPFHLE